MQSPGNAAPSPAGARTKRTHTIVVQRTNAASLWPAAMRAMTCVSTGDIVIGDLCACMRGPRGARAREAPRAPASPDPARFSRPRRRVSMTADSSFPLLQCRSTAVAPADAELSRVTIVCGLSDVGKDVVASFEVITVGAPARAAEVSDALFATVSAALLAIPGAVEALEPAVDQPPAVRPESAQA